MTIPQLTLWNKIQEFQIDNPQGAFTFTHRLARENGWKLSYAIRAVDEYKKFIFLLCISPHPLTPSEQTDQVWHLHLLYTESYWKDFCEKTVEWQIHHGPTKGGTQEAEKFIDWYARTLEMYRAVFLSEPPADIWPDPATRFKHSHFKWVNARTTWCIPKPQLLIRFQLFIVKLLKRKTM